MFLKKLSIINFKNVVDMGLEFSNRINCFVGDNGAGKTNIIDAVHYLSMCKSSLVMTDLQSVRHGQDFFLLDGQYMMENGMNEVVVCSFARDGGKSLKRNGKEYERLSDHIGLLPLVIISPSDTFLISDAADERRRYINSFLSQLDRQYLNALMRYNHVLSERNSLLKQHGFSADLLDILDMQMVQWGEIVCLKRKELVAKLSPIVGEFYRLLSHDSEQVCLSYRSELDGEQFADLLLRARDKDRVNGFSTCGIHRDDIVMQIGGLPLKKYGSQGQQKSFLVALKLAQYTIVAENCGEKPLLLLDDLFDKLDMNRVERLIQIVGAEDFGQIFITDCNKLRLESILDRSGHDYSVFNISQGEIDTYSTDYETN